MSALARSRWRKRWPFGVAAAVAIVLATAVLARPLARAVLADPQSRAQIRRVLRVVRYPLYPGALTTWRDSVPPGATTTAAGIRRPALPRTLDLREVGPLDLAPTRTIRPLDAAALHAALADARSGDLILLRPGTAYRGTFTLRAREDVAGWVTIRTDLGRDSLPAGSRMTAMLAGQMRLARLVVPPGSTAPALTTRGAARGYRVAEVEITVDSSISTLRELVRLGDPTERDLREVPQLLVLDRVYVHALEHTALRRCLQLASGATALLNSTLDECHERGFDSMAIAAWAGPGPYHIENNYLAGAGMGILIGGGTPSVDGLLPADITIRRNHITRPDGWRERWSVKNLVEFKYGRRILLEANVLERNWADGQAGFAVLLKSVNQDGDAPWSELSDVTLRHNVLRGSAAGFTVAAAPEGYPAVPASRIAIEENLAFGVGRYAGTANGRMIMLLGDLRDILIARNTFLHSDGGTQALLLDDGARGRRLEVIDNLLTAGEYGVWSSAGVGTQALESAWRGAWTFRGNALLVPAIPPARWQYPGTPAGFLVEPELLARANAAATGSEVRSVLAALARVSRAGARVRVVAERVAGVAPDWPGLAADAPR